MHRKPWKTTSTSDADACRIWHLAPVSSGRKAPTATFALFQDLSELSPKEIRTPETDGYHFVIRERGGDAGLLGR